ncbi:MAG TPA: CAP domain-containing protein [Candidatus Eremiobacteraceae bacterium]|nr:CAP domain-containing protein [Candidatus Eremiobacteraceae bacterium]
MATTIAAAAVVSACGGGGGAVSGPPTGGSPSPTPSLSPATVTGTVTDFDSGSPLVGAIVKVAGQTTMTNGSGVYAVSGIAGGSILQYLQIADGSSYATYNGGVLVTAGQTTTRNVKLMNPSTNCPGCAAWLAQVNTDRANNGAGSVAFDEAAMETARQHATDMFAQGYFADDDTNGTSWYARYAQKGGVGLDDSNIGLNTTWQNIESSMMAEGPGGPHHDNIVNPRHQWVGLWATATGYQGGPNLVGDQEFVDLYDVFDPAEAGNSVTSGTQVSVHVLSLGSPSLFFQMGSLPLPSPMTPGQLNTCDANNNCPPGFPASFSSIGGAGVPGVPNLYKETATLSPSGQYFMLSASGTHFLGVTWIEAR